MSAPVSSQQVNVLLTHLFERVGLRLGNQAHGVRRLLDTKKGLPIDLCALLVLLGKRLGIKVGSCPLAAVWRRPNCGAAEVHSPCGSTHGSWT